MAERHPGSEQAGEDVTRGTKLIDPSAGAAEPGVKFSLAEYVVLSLVAEGPTYGFAVARLLEPTASIGRVFHVPRPVVYRSIDRLIEAGMVVPGRVEAGNRGPQRTLISATASGRKTSQRWLTLPVAHVRDIRTELLVKLALLGLTRRSSTALIEAQRRLLEPIVAALGDQREKAEGFDRTLASWRYETAQAALRFLDHCGG
jgi:PadR family transcriptional regulator AphA